MRKTLQATSLLLLATFSISQVALAQGGMDSSNYNNMAEHVNRGIKLMRANNLQSALSEFEAAKAVDAKNPVVLQNLAEVHNHMGYELFRRKSYQDAIGEFEKCVAIYPSHNQARHNIALCKQAMEKAGIDNSADADEDKSDKSKTAAKSEKTEDKDKTADKPKDKDKDKEKKEDSSPKIVGASGGATIAPNGTGLYMSGSQLFPVYSSTPTGASMPTTSINATPSSAASSASSVPSNAANSGAFGSLGISPTFMGTPTPSAPALENPPGYLPATPNTPAATTSAIAGTSTSAISPIATPAAPTVTSSTTGAANPAASINPGGDDFENGGSTPTPTASPSPSAPALSTNTTSIVGPYNSASSSSPASSSAAPINRALSTPSSSRALSTPANINTEGSYASPAASAGPDDSETSSNTNSGDATGDKVAELEVKVYGKKNNTLPLKKRIEQLEIEEFGKERTGPMSKRVDNLIKAIGLH